MAAVKSRLSEEEIGTRLKEMVYQLTPDGVIELLSQTNEAADAQAIPQSIKTQLRFAEKKLPRNILDIVRRHLKFVANDYTESPDFFKEDQLNVLKTLLENYKQYILNYVSIVSGLLAGNEKKEDGWEALRQKMFAREADGMKRNQEVLRVKLDNCKEHASIKNKSIVKYSEALMEKLRIIWSKDVEQTQMVKNGRQILVIRGPVLLLSEVLELVEPSIEGSSHAKRIEEVHFIAQEIFYLDRDLEQDKWHGMNILVMSKKVVCLPVLTPDLTWNVSGLNGEDVRQGGNDTGNQLHGRDGLMGEHGGHVLFVTEEFDGIDYLKVIGNGGAGEDGENGKNGQDGVNGRNGTEMSLENMKQLFPSFVQSDQVRRILLDNLGNEIAYICFSVPFKITFPISVNNYKEGKLNSDLLVARSSFYINAMTRAGLHIECGFRKGRGAFMLVKGQRGTPGTRGLPGGQGGVAGTGGLEGSVVAYFLQKLDGQKDLEKVGPALKGTFERGQDGIAGKNGKRGVDGTEGMVGTDVGFIEKKGMRKDYFEAGYYELVVSEGRQETAVFSDYHEMYVGIQPMRFDKQQQPAQNYVESRAGNENEIPQAETRVSSAELSKPEITNLPIDPEVVLNLYGEYALRDEIEHTGNSFDLQFWRNMLLK